MGGIIQHFTNDIAPKQQNQNGDWTPGYTEWDVPGLGWHALTVIASNGKNQIDPARDNVDAIEKWAVGGASVIAAGVGLALIPLTGGASGVLTAGAIAGIVTTIAGGTLVVADLTISGISASLSPASISNLYGPDGYNFTISGGEITVVQHDKDIQITAIAPLKIHWVNNTSGTSGDEYAVH